MKKIRAFLAVEVPWSIRAKALELAELLSHSPANVKWVDDTEMHFTLKFLGDVQANETPAIFSAVRRAIADLPAFEARVMGAGAFPKSERPRTVWIGVNPASIDPFVELHDRIEEELKELGHRVEHRRYRPHMTLGRVRRSPDGIEELAALIAAQAQFDAGAITVEEVTLFSSELTRQGPLHESLGRVELLSEKS